MKIFRKNMRKKTRKIKKKKITEKNTKKIIKNVLKIPKTKKRKRNNSKDMQRKASKNRKNDVQRKWRLENLETQKEYTENCRYEVKEREREGAGEGWEFSGSYCIENCEIGIRHGIW